MPSKFRQRCLLWFVFIILGLSISLWGNNIYGKNAVAASIPPEENVTRESTDVEQLETQAKYYYSVARFERAIASWQQVNEIYTQSEDALNQGRILSNLALAYSQLNNEPEAIQKIDASLNLLAKSSASVGDKVPILAQVLNNQGIILLNRGKPEQAISVWQRAKVNYGLIEDDLGIIRVSINQASAFKELGLYRRALKTLTDVETQLAQQPDSLIKTTGLRSYGDVLRLVGQVKRSQEMLEASLAAAYNIDNPNEEVKALMALGNAHKVGQPTEAIELYDRGLDICQANPDCQSTDLSLQINLAKLNLRSDSPQWRDGQELIAPIQAELARLPDNRANIDRTINFAHVLVKLHHKSLETKYPLDKIPSLPAIEALLKDTIEQAKAIDYQKAQSYGWGLQGQIEEDLQQWDAAQKYTRRALVLGQKLNAPEIVYLWQWQSGRINRALGNRPEAIAHYARAVELLKSLSRDLVAIDPDVQYSFREGVEPVYRELVNLLLADPNSSVSQANLEGAREVIESLQLAELNNFFREACLDAQVVNIDSVDKKAAVIYPIILGDRLEVILSLPDRPLQHYSTEISNQKLETIIEEYRQNIVVRSRRNFYRSSEQLYDLLIRPALSDLAHDRIETIVFVPDGSLRNIPFSALYNGEQYIIENYNIALTPGLQLLSPRPLEQIKLKTIAAGITESRQGFSSLKYVNSELEKIEDRVDSVVLLNEDFTTESLQKKIKFSDRPIVHIATHGQFSSSLEDTFLVAWNDRININQLDRILQTRNPSQKDAIELLVLSACETATGDKRAALGLAGMAVRAGARSTLATLWSVNDRATAKLMSDFYYELSDRHLTKADAVRQAQLSLLRTRGYEHPFYWASYVLLGNWL